MRAVRSCGPHTSRRHSLQGPPSAVADWQIGMWRTQGAAGGQPLCPRCCAACKAQLAPAASRAAGPCWALSVPSRAWTGRGSAGGTVPGSSSEAPPPPSSPDRVGGRSCSPSELLLRQLAPECDHHGAGGSQPPGAMSGSKRPRLRAPGASRTTPFGHWLQALTGGRRRAVQRPPEPAVGAPAGLAGAAPAPGGRAAPGADLQGGARPGGRPAGGGADPAGPGACPVLRSTLLSLQAALSA